LIEPSQLKRKEKKTALTLDVIFFCMGLLMLYFGAEWLVKKSSALALGLGISPLVVGLTVVAFGTSAPELVVSLVSAIKGKSMIAVGNVVGSNICNIALVLGLAAVFHPLSCDRSVVRRDIPIMLGVSAYLLILSLNSRIGRIEGATLFGGVILYTVMNYYLVMRSAKARIGHLASGFTAPKSNDAGVDTTRWKQALLITAGIGGVVAGADLLIDSAVKIMMILGVSEKFVGLTIVALGTSMPELATSVVAALRKEMDISIGNLVGSNVFNIMSVLGAASLVRPIAIPGGFIGSALWIDYAVMIITSFLPWLMMRKTAVVSRRDGILLLACYTAYIAYLTIKA
jgi:cation:H+ antiporter